MRNEQPGIDPVIVELAHALPQYADAADVHGAFSSRIMQASASIDKLTEHEIILAKQLEVVRETKTQLINNREYDIGSVATKGSSTTQAMNLATGHASRKSQPR